LIRKPAPRTGATLLAEVVHLGITGAPLDVMAWPAHEEERRRTLTARLSATPVYLVLDNATYLDSSALSAAITGTRWTDRCVGTSRTLELPIDCVWVATANNPILSHEIATRTVDIHLDAKMEKPWERTKFKHPNLREWAAKHRRELIWAQLVLVRASQAKGLPVGTRTLGGFESYARVMGGILDVIGVAGFLANQPELHRATDYDTGGWARFFTRWWNTFGSRPVGVSDVYPLIEPDGTNPIDLGLDKGKGRDDKAQRMALGKRLSQVQGRIIGGFRILPAGTFHHAQQWRLERVGDGNLGKVGGGLFPGAKGPSAACGELGELGEGVHRLRHTFCSHLAMRCAPARSIQELAGHQDLRTTQRSMHLSPAAIESAIRLLDSPGIHPSRGNIVATGSTETANASR
jgi:putative DNA primase/helicase